MKEYEETEVHLQSLVNWGLFGDRLSCLRSNSVFHGETASATLTGRQLDRGFGLLFWRRKKYLAITENRTIAPRFSSPWCSHYYNCLSSVPVFSTGVKVTVCVKYCYLDVMEDFKIGCTCLNITHLIV